LLFRTEKKDTLFHRDPAPLDPETFGESRANNVAKRHKVLAAAALWGACAWFASLDVDILVTNLHNAPHWLLQGFRALFMGASVGIGYLVYRKYLLEMQTRGEKYAEIRVQIRLLLAELLTVRDEDLIHQLQNTIKRIEQLLKRYDPEAAYQTGEPKRPRVA
jgi:hypothetical protein